MSIDILLSVKLSDKFYLNLVNDYLKRIKKLTINVKYYKSVYPLIKSLDKYDIIIGLDERGKSFTSPQFAKKIFTYLNDGLSKIAFCLGEAHGLDKTIKQKANFLLKLSDFTLNHRLALLVLCEQLYRAYAINFNIPYHK